MRRGLDTVKPGGRLPLVSGGVAAGLASVMLVILFGVYVLPFGTSHGSGVPVDSPTIRAGEAYFDKPPSIIVTLRSDHSIYVGPNVVRRGELQSHLKSMRANHPDHMVELRAFKSATLGELAPLLSAMHGAGYSHFWVFGKRSSVLELVARAGT